MFTEPPLCARAQKQIRQAKPPALSEWALRLWGTDCPCERKQIKHEGHRMVINALEGKTNNTQGNKHQKQLQTEIRLR